MGTQILENCTQHDVESIARNLALASKNGDLITLSGVLGAGKSLFARAFIRQYQQMPDLEVPSPTYLIAIEYNITPAKNVTHVDLYRISGDEELDELGIDEALQDGIVLLEWPQQVSHISNVQPLDICFEITDEFTRKLIFTGNKNIITRYRRSAQIDQFLRQNIPAIYSRNPIDADASARNYELINFNNEIRILMDAPKATDGPIVKNGLPYSQIAHLAEEVRPFVAMAKLLRANGIFAPQIFAHDYDSGLVLLEYLGDEPIIDSKRCPILERYVQAAKLLAHIHKMKWHQSNKYGEGELYHIPTFDEPAMIIEVELLTNWYLKEHQSGGEKEDIEEYLQIWSRYCALAQNFSKSIVLRDYHSPNIIWNKQNEGNDRLGVIDFQDAMIGPAVYDLVSLAQDARIEIDGAQEEQIIRHYLGEAAANDIAIDEPQFRFEYAMMGAQRASKLLGLFVRLDIRDGKSAYRKLLPGMRNYLERNLQHPKLSQYRNWCERVIKL